MHINFLKQKSIFYYRLKLREFLLLWIWISRHGHWSRKPEWLAMILITGLIRDKQWTWMWPESHNDHQLRIKFALIKLIRSSKGNCDQSMKMKYVVITTYNSYLIVLWSHANIKRVRYHCDYLNVNSISKSYWLIYTRIFAEKLTWISAIWTCTCI